MGGLLGLNFGGLTCFLWQFIYVWFLIFVILESTTAADNQYGAPPKS